MKPAYSVAVLVFLVACYPGSVRAQTYDKEDEIPIEHCDRLPVVTMKIAGEDRRFLLDTAATTILNLNSFTSGESKETQIYSWSGSRPTSAREVFLPRVDLGTHKLLNLKLTAIDLGAIGRACGGQIDGILGVDLLEQMGMTIDLKRRVAVPAAEPGDSADAFAEAEGDMGSCEIAFNQGDATALEDCFDPDVVFYTPHGEYRGRQEVISYLSQRYFKSSSKPQYSAQPHDARRFGDLLWYSYDFSIDSPKEHITGHGMTMCRKAAGGRWRILNVNNSVKEATAAPAVVH